MDEISGVNRRTVDADETRRANRAWWDEAAPAYQLEHGAELGVDRFIWCPEGLDESDVRLLGDDLYGRRVLEIGAGAAQCSRWLARQGAEVVATDLSYEQLVQSQRFDAMTGTHVPVLTADGCALPFASESFDLVVSAFGAVPFVADPGLLMREAARVLRPGGRWVFSTTHPIRWCFPDDGGPDGLVARHSYFDRRPYVEEGPDGHAAYVEHHRTLGDRVRDVVAAGLTLVDLVEPEWQEGHVSTWEVWSPLRGRVIPGTAIFVCEKPRVQDAE